MRNRKIELVSATLFAVVIGHSVGVSACLGQAWVPFSKPTSKSFIPDDTRHTKMLGTQLFKCYYPANWSYTKKEWMLIAIHELSAPDGTAWVRLSEVPKFPNTPGPADSVEQSMTRIKLSAIPPLAGAERAMSKYGQSNVAGKVFMGFLRPGPIQYRCFTVKQCPNNFFALVEELRYVDDKHQAGLDLIEKSFESRCGWETVSPGTIQRTGKRIYVSAADVLTANLAEKILGAPVSSLGNATRNGKIVSCSYRTKAGPDFIELSKLMMEKAPKVSGPLPKIVQLTIYNDRPEGEAAASFETEMSSAKIATKFKPVDLGASAFWGRTYRVPTPAPQLFMLMDENFIIINVGTVGSNKPDVAGAELLAKAVLARFSAAQPK